MKFVKSIGFLVLCTAIYLICFNVKTEAHEFKTAFDTTVELHIEPGHSRPQAKRLTSVELNFVDKSGIFKLSNCICNAYINSDTKNIAKFMNIASDATGSNSYKTDFIFPEIGKYQVALTASPKADANFKPFVLVYDVDVDSIASASLQKAASDSLTKTDSHEKSQYGLYGVLAINLLLIFILVYLLRKKGYLAKIKQPKKR